MNGGLQLKTYVREMGGQILFAERLAQRGVQHHSSIVCDLLRDGTLPKRNPERFRAAVEQLVVEAGYDPESAWQAAKEKPGNASVGADDVTGLLGHEGKPTNPTRGNPNMTNHTKEYLEPEHLRHFRLNEDPFFELGDHAQVWLPDRLARIKHLIELTVQNQSIMVLTGDYGAGKSTILRHVLGALVADRRTHIIAPDRLDRSAMRGDMITLAIIEELGGGMHIPRAAGQRDKLAKRLLGKTVQRGEWPLLVIDEAHDMRSQLFIALKRLWDSGLILRNIAIVLAGAGGKDTADGRSWGLRWEIEGNPDLKEFAERSRLVDLGRLAEDLPKYLHWRFAAVEADASAVFEPEAISILAEQGRTPQLLGILAIKAMKEAYLDGDLKVNADHVGRVH